MLLRRSQILNAQKRSRLCLRLDNQNVAGVVSRIAIVVPSHPGADHLGVDRFIPNVSLCDNPFLGRDIELDRVAVQNRSSGDRAETNRE
ncbi:hypothetical protein KR51_00026110 [Rubidibacter lacunae KORDI 51-2]|uniref:Uncharacterized protein n=1 Tax=Rubidibacter lacunae KORDI 51-2 TaxID=582515 RepID=U5D8F7_9CHRO|nr:hypothetical protein KR51_00026110 [Rubidibacter lacunae KORDI 51-2]